MRTRTVTLAKLKRVGACRHERTRIKRLFGDRPIPFNRDLAMFVIRTMDRGPWVVDHLLTYPQRQVYLSKTAGCPHNGDGSLASYWRCTLVHADALVEAYHSPTGKERRKRRGRAAA